MKNRNLLLTMGDMYYGIKPYPILKKLMKSQYFTTEQLEALQLEHLRKLVSHTIAHVPFYREYFNGKSVEINSLKDIEQFPVVDKKLINSSYQDFVADDAKKPYSIAKTTGSSGVPFSFIKTRIAESYKIASRLRGKNWFDVGRCDRVMKISGIPPLNESLKNRIFDKLRFMATKKDEIFISEMTDENISMLVEKMNACNPDAIIGLAGGVALLAVKLKGNPNLKCRVKAVFVNSESITPLMRRQIKECFGVEPRSDYAATEGSIGHECECGRLHLDMEECFAEIINTDEKGVGEFLLTMLHSFDMPLIRYRIGDQAKWHNSLCECGRGLKVVEDVIGRTTDVITIPNGEEYSSANINYLVCNLKSVKNLVEYQIVQTAKDEILFKMVLVDENDTSVVEEMLAEFAKVLVGCKFRTQVCKALERGRGGKLRLVVGLNSSTKIL